MPGGPHHIDVIAHPRNGWPPRNSESTLDVLSNLRTESEVETTSGHTREIPGLEGHEHRTARKGEGEARLHSKVRRVFEREESDTEGVVDRLGNVKDVETECLDTTGVVARGLEWEAVAHSGDDFHTVRVVNLDESRPRPRPRSRLTSISTSTSGLIVVR